MEMRSQERKDDDGDDERNKGSNGREEEEMNSKKLSFLLLSFCFMNRAKGKEKFRNVCRSNNMKYHTTNEIRIFRRFT